METRSPGTGRPCHAARRERAGHVRHHARDLRADYLAMSSADAPLFSAFISGWFNQKTGHVTVDLNEYARNVANVRSWCASNPGETVFAGLQRATGTSGQ